MFESLNSNSITENMTSSRETYWNLRYTKPDWSNGIHIGRFASLEPQLSLEEAGIAADSLLVQEILELCSVFRLMTGFKVLEIGCGNGSLASSLYNSIPKIEYLGFDISKSAIESAINKFNTINDDLNQSVNFLCAGVGEFLNENTPKFSESVPNHSPLEFDLIIIREVFYLLSEAERSSLIEFAKHSLRPGGVFYFADIFLVGSESKNTLSTHLYKRHFSHGPILELQYSNDIAVTNWLNNTFTDVFSVIQCEIDEESIEKTYSTALSLDISNKKNKDAYIKLTDAASRKINCDPDIVYVKAFLFKSGQTDCIYKHDDYHFVASSTYYDVIVSNHTYGVFKNRWNFIIGRSGCGKTSLLKALEGELPSVTGTSTNLLDVDTYFFLSQDIDIFENLSPSENVSAFGLDPSKANTLLKKLGIKDRVLNGNKKSTKLSGGEKQRIAIAQCIASEPEVIVLDEPSQGLDKIRRIVLFDLLTQYFRNSDDLHNRTLICVDHDFELIYSRFDFVFEMLHGHQILMWSKTDI